MNKDYSYQIALSFAGDDREYVRAVAEHLRSRGIRVFFDEFEEAKLLGKNLHDYLTDVYYAQSQYCVAFISQHYPLKNWPNRVERPAAFARSIESDQEYFIPVRLDDTEIKGLLPTIGYARKRPATQLADLLIEKLYQDATVTGPDNSTATRLRIWFPSLTHFDDYAFTKSLEQFRGWSSDQLDQIDIDLRIPNSIAKWLDQCDAFLETDDFREVPDSTQLHFKNFLRETKAEMIPSIATGVKAIISSLKLEHVEDVQLLAAQYCKSKVIQLIRSILDCQLVAMASAEWLKHFRLFHLHDVMHFANHLAYIAHCSGDEDLFWVDADLRKNEGAGTLSLKHKRVYVPATLLLRDGIRNLSKMDFLKFIAPQLVEDFVIRKDTNWLNYFYLYPDRAKFTLRGEWLIETKHFAQVSTSNSGGRDALPAIEKAVDRVRELSRDQERPDLAEFALLCDIECSGDMRDLVNQARRK